MSSRSDKRRSGLARFWLALAGTFVVLTGVVLALPHDPYVRYQSLNGTIYDKATWIYERIHMDPEPIDVVLIGSSRMNRGVNALALERALEDRGVAANVANFSMPSAGLDIRHTILEEVFDSKSPKLVVFSVVEAFPRDGHDAWAEIAPVSEVLGAPLIVNRNLPSNLLRMPVRQLTLAAATRVPEAWNYRSDFDPSAYLGDGIYDREDDDEAFLKSAEHKETLERQAKRRFRQITPPILPESLSWVEFGVSQSYLKDVAALAKAHDAEIAFLFLPFYTGYDAPIEEAWLSELGPVWKATFFKDDPENYIDSGHAANTPRMREMISGWLADRIAPLVTENG